MRQDTTRRRRRRLGLILALAAMSAIAAPSMALGASPTVVATSAVSASGSSTVQLNGTIDTSACGSSFTQWYFEFGSEQQSNYSYDPSNPANPSPFQGVAPNPWGSALSGTANQTESTTIPASGAPALTPGVLYYWRMTAVVQTLNPPPPGANCAAGRTYSSVQCFKLGVGSVPCPAQVQATFTVVNRRGRPQDAYVHAAWAGSSSYNGYPTTPDGQLTLTVQPGEVLRFSRTPDVSGACAAPEGSAFPGFLYTVPDTPQSQVTIQLDNTTTSDAPEVPTLSPAERWVVGKINDMRAAKGLGRLRISTTLDRVAYATAHDAAALRAANGSYPWPPKYCAAVGDDWGWPQLALGDRVFGGNDDATNSAAGALEHWTDASAPDSGAKARTGLTFNSSTTDIGIADGGTAWTMFVGDCSDRSSGPPLFPGGPTPAPLPGAVATRCELTTDLGDSSIRLPSAGGGNAAGPAAQALIGALGKSLRHVSAAALLKKGSWPVRFTAKSRGSAAAKLSATGGGAHHGSVALAQGSVKVSTIGNQRLLLRLTKAGRTLLANAHKQHRAVHATCQATFTPPGGKPVSRSVSVTISG